LSLTRFGGQVVKPLVPSVRFLFFSVVVVSCGNCGTRSSIVSTAPAASTFLESRDQRACLKYKIVLGCRLLLVALEIIGATISQRRMETLRIVPGFDPLVNCCTYIFACHPLRSMDQFRFTCCVKT